MSKAKILVLAAALVCVGLGAASDGRASDHSDGPTTLLDLAADLTDLFAFTSPQDPSKLVLIMVVHPFAFGSSEFSDAVDYKLRIRPVTDPKTLTASSDATQERSIVCNFAGGVPFVDARQHATCVLNLNSGKRTIQFDTRGSGGPYSAGGSGQLGSTRVFAGVRSDPWFLDLAKTVAYNTGLPTLGPGINGLHEANVLSIVVEVDAQELPGPLLAVNAQTVRKTGQ